MISILSGCAATATTQADGASAAKPNFIAAAKDAPPACTGGWHACVCDKEAKCCSFRQDCECGTGDAAGKAICK
jgi:hypothetical protein